MILRYQVVVDYSLRHGMVWRDKVLRRTLKIMTKNIHCTSWMVKKTNYKLKTKCLVLLV